MVAFSFQSAEKRFLLLLILLLPSCVATRKIDEPFQEEPMQMHSHANTSTVLHKWAWMFGITITFHLTPEVLTFPSLCLISPIYCYFLISLWFLHCIFGIKFQPGLPIFPVNEWFAYCGLTYHIYFCLFHFMQTVDYYSSTVAFWRLLHMPFNCVLLALSFFAWHCWIGYGQCLSSGGYWFSIKFQNCLLSLILWIHSCFVSCLVTQLRPWFNRVRMWSTGLVKEKESCQLWFYSMITLLSVLSLLNL